MAQPERQSPTQQPLGFDYDEGHAEQGLTALAGIPVLLQAFRSLDLPRSVGRHVSVKQRQRGLDEASYVESFLILNAAGGECLDDFAHLRQDGVGELIGLDLPSPEAARKFLYQFHDDQLIEQAQQRLLPGQISYIPEENPALEGLGQVNVDLVRELASRGEPQKMATIDLDSTGIESWKQQAQPTYQCGRGYQPLLAVWAEMNLIVADEFRDGNVPAVQEPLRVARRAFQSLPETATEYYFRGDSACYDKQLMNWLRNDQREGFARGPIWFCARRPPSAAPDAWVFPSETLKTPLGRDNCWRRHFKPKLEEIGLGWVNLHVFRRTHSSLLRDLGIEAKVRADQMGHTVDVNENVYTKTSLERRREAVNALESALRVM